MSHRVNFSFNNFNYGIDRFENNKESKITIDYSETIKVLIEPSIKRITDSSSGLKYLDSLITIIKYQKYFDYPKLEKYKQSSKLIMDSKETDEQRRPMIKRKKYLGALGILLLNAIDLYLKIAEYDFVITAPIFFEDDPPEIDNIMNYREHYLLGIVGEIYEKDIIHHLIKKKEDKHMKELSPQKKIEFAENGFIIDNDSNDIEQKNILVIDDVSTTGCTGYGIAKQLKENLNARKVDLIAVAQTL